MLTISDSKTPETDTSGTLIREHLTGPGTPWPATASCATSPPRSPRSSGRAARIPRVEAFILTGGTGVTSRDSTFEAVEALLDKRLTGFGELFRMLSYAEVGAAAMLSRAQGGVVQGRALFSLPGSPNACRLALEKLILPELGHVLREVRRDPLRVAAELHRGIIDPSPIATPSGGLQMRRPALPSALVLSLVLLSAAVAPARAAEPLWRDSPGASAPPDIARLNDFMHDLSERMKPSLVQVRVRRAAEPQAEGQEQQGTPEERRSAGSGFIIREDGYLVTNAHVVGDADRIQVRLSDGRRFDGRLVGLDERVDLALLKIEAGGLPVALLGDSNRTRVGEFVLALGHPFGLEQTVSFGIVSRKGAPIQVAAPGFEFIQTDAAVNPGNSGGPLVNMAGEVVGINSMAAVNGSIGFAIPVNLVKALLPQLAENGKVEWGWLGVSIAEVPDEDAAKFGLKEPKGVLIRQVVVGQPADQGGIKANDVVVSVDGASVEGPRDLQRIISSTPVGKIVKISLMREGKEQEVAVTVGAYQAAPTRAPRRPGAVPAPRQPQPSPQPPR